MNTALFTRWLFANQRKGGGQRLQHLQLLTHCSWRLQVKVSDQLMKSRSMRWRNEGYDLKRVSPHERVVVLAQVICSIELQQITLPEIR